MTAIATAQAQLFGTAGLLPPGLQFEPAFISAAEEGALVSLAAALPLRQARYKEYTARRRVFAYGMRLDVSLQLPQPADAADLPPPLQTLRQRLAAWVGVAATEFVQVMVAEYQRGVPLGWHRNAPGYELIAGVSLASPARLRFRPYPPDGPQAPHTPHTPHPRHPPRKDAIVALDLAPRSAYAMRGPARWGWQHSVPPVPGLRYSVTMRTARALPGNIK